ncbi:hypothetical protein AVEN_200956-1 [Araneus ventricosus]|uniref:RNase H type-1 domain-containing protein n=1 Tax=Araneus ventricosus TaxID=182803 RepID=A0A4Y2D166_ARAVE|nr:hypothetical protein AVEN_46775-1 [Araneus ventricosus]GBM10479.1 hypothetical protein AVEN_122465-1 [Araneus ventricosus]GBM10488.1 hypothetical protein AVEN_132462-1 [Araneus ventricosus]GBM10502.1 hypothetical protein AVEN_200956-1 [Araneus ventricosus]
MFLPNSFLDPNDFKGPSIHPDNFNIEKQVFTDPAYSVPGIQNSSFTDGSKTNDGTGSAFVYFGYNLQVDKEWKTKLSLNNSIFKAKLLAISEAIGFLSSASDSRTFWTDSFSCLQSTSNPFTTH